MFSGPGRNVPSSHTEFPWGRIIYTLHLENEVGSIWWVQEQEVNGTAQLSGFFLAGAASSWEAIDLVWSQHRQHKLRFYGEADMVQGLLVMRLVTESVLGFGVRK